jgi:hypothetical protein
MIICFLNIDLEVESSENLKVLIDDLGEDVSVLYQGENGSGFNFVSFAVRPSGEKDADGIISSFCLFIENLSLDAKLIWNKSHSKKFDVGFQSGNSPRSYQTEIRADTVKKVAEIGASIIVTVYPLNN